MLKLGINNLLANSLSLIWRLLDKKINGMC